MNVFLQNQIMSQTEICKAKLTTKQLLPIFTATIEAGFPSPADDHVEMQLDLNQFLIKHPTATFFVRVNGNSMQNAGIFSGDILVVDKSLQPAHGKIVVAIVDGEFTVKRIQIENGVVFLAPENDLYKRVQISSESQFQVWGVVTYVIHKAK